jgi:hypothetical protein
MTPNHINDDHLDAALTRHFMAPSRTDDDSAHRVARRLAAHPLPRQTGTPWLRWPTVLLNWDFTPAWPRVTALAACAALGFVIGLAGLDTRIDDASAATTITSGDLQSLIFDLEPL